MRATTGIALLLSSFLVLACSALKSGYGVPARHPEEVSGKPTCSECHTPALGSANYSRLNHTLYFAEDHREQARQMEKVCSMCHEQSYCARCHDTKATQYGRGSPHQGDYLSRHRIDGRVDPTSCFRCHGNPRGAAICARCHGR